MDNEIKNIILTIKDLFGKLSGQVQFDLYSELGLLLNQISIKDFCALVQSVYKKNIQFDIRTDIENNTPIITPLAYIIRVRNKPNQLHIR